MTPCHIKPNLKKTTKRRKSPKKKSVIQILFVPKIVATMPIRALVADSTSVLPMEPHTEVFAPTDYIGMTKKSKNFRTVGTRVPPSPILVAIGPWSTPHILAVTGTKYFPSDPFIAFWPYPNRTF